MKNETPCDQHLLVVLVKLVGGHGLVSMLDKYTMCLTPSLALLAKRFQIFAPAIEGVKSDGRMK